MLTIDETILDEKNWRNFKLRYVVRFLDDSLSSLSHWNKATHLVRP